MHVKGYIKLYCLTTNEQIERSKALEKSHAAMQPMFSISNVEQRSFQLFFSPGGEDCSALLVLAVALDDDMPPQHLVFLGQGQAVHAIDPSFTNKTNIVLGLEDAT